MKTTIQATRSPVQWHVGMLLEAGQQVRTGCGRLTSPFPTVLVGGRWRGTKGHPGIRGALRASGVIRIDPGAGISTIASWNRPMNKFRGVLECRILDKQLVLINELPLEDYMAGLGEEPDTEPYEKQRAFAAAARTYAAWYLSADNRKFPGMPYDGSDAPSQFQKYSGYAFETANPNWVKAVKNTAPPCTTAPFGADPLPPGLRSTIRFVPAAVPSDHQGSSPPVRSRPVKKMRLPVTTRRPTHPGPLPGSTSSTIRVPAVVPSETHSS